MMSDRMRYIYALLLCLLARSRPARAFAPALPRGAPPVTAGGAARPRWRPRLPDRRGLYGSAQDFNEFSRKVSVDRIVGAAGAGRRRPGGGGSNLREHRMELTASPAECVALAGRFRLEGLANLEAALVLRAAYSGDGDVQAVGTLRAALTQRCVRTNELFNVTVDCPVDTIVRPVLPEGVLFQNDDYQSPAGGDGGNSNKKKKNKPKRQRVNSQTIEDLDVIELQRLIDSDVLLDDDNVMEDEAILTLGEKLDVGELVSQLFYLSLDPYPKKPGSEWTPTTVSTIS